uniref:autotransporter-associated beta strand repeat-containing protein n=1 Tax=Bradyrhizobium sp. (strain ORS 278) TaxID=114615 RepID=UPI0002EAF7EF|nr:autotransporter-associated beta strand repeat-containing protein [Bradyrhizobium sp. ORS 278]
MLLGTASILVLASRAGAQSVLPQGASVASGQVSFANPSSNALTVTQTSAKAIVNWNSFSVGSNASVNFAQPNANAAILNRVTGNTSSTIAGKITGNGQVYLVNPNGIAITPSGSVQVGGGFVASTLDISDADFNAGRLNFTGKGASAAVSNAGTISGAPGSYVGLIGGSVSNSGTINVPLGKVGLGAGEQVTLDPSGDGFLQVALPTGAKAADGKALLDVSGKIRAAGGRVEIRAAAAQQAARDVVNVSGAISARSVSGRSGNIVLGGGGGAVTVSGRLAANGGRRQAGGTIVVSGSKVALTETAKISANGTSGGTILIGGDQRGGSDPAAKLVGGDVQNARTTTVAQGATISANGSKGEGGKIVLWSDQFTDFRGTISATAGGAGNGGAVETSSHGVLNYQGTTDVTAQSDRTGTLLLDPYNVTISSGSDTNHDASFAATGSGSIINVTTLQNALASANVTVSTGSSGAEAGDITLNSSLSWVANTLLTLNAAGGIILNAGVTNSGASSGLTLTANGSAGISGAASLANSGMLTLNTAAGSSSTYSGAISGSGSLVYNGPGTLTLSGTNSYTGATTINAGTLGFTHDQASTTGVTVASGATLSLSNNAAVSNPTAGVTTVAGTVGGNGTLYGYYAGGGDAAGLVLTGNATLSASGGSLALNGSASGTHSWGVQLASGANVTTNGAVTLNASGSGTAGYRRAFIVTGNAAINAATGGLTVNIAESGGDVRFSPQGNTLTLGGTQNWNINSPGWSDAWSASNGAFNLTTLANANVSLASNGNGWNSNMTGWTWTLGAGSQVGITGVLLNGTLGLSGTGTLTTPLPLTGNSTISTPNGSDAATISGAVSGGYSLTKDGPGSLILAGANTYTGTTTVNSGTLAQSNTTASSAFTVASGATLQVGNSSFDYTFNPTTASAISGAGTLQKIGTNIVTFAGTSASATFTWGLSSGGLIDVQAGKLVGGNYQHDIWTGNLSSLNVASGAVFDGVEANLVLDRITGSGSITSGWGAPIYSGMTIGAANGSSTFNGVISNRWGNAAITKLGTGTITLSGANTYTGATTVNSGTLALSNTTSSSAFTVASGATLQVGNSSFDYTFNPTAASSISGAGTLQKTGTNTVAFAGTSSSATFTWGLSSAGLIDVQAGKLVGGHYQHDVWTGNLSSLNVAAGATFDGVEANVIVDRISGAGTIKSGWSGSGYNAITIGAANGSSTFSGVIADSWSSASITKAGTGTITLSGANALTGTTTVNAGTLALSPSGSSAMGSILVGGGASGATLVVNSGSTALTGDLVVGAASADKASLAQISANLTANNVYIGNANGAIGTVNQSAGTLTTTALNDPNFGIGSAVGGMGTYNLSGGTAVVTNGIFNVGGYGAGTLNQSGGTINAGWWAIVGRRVGSSGVYNLSGGQFNQTGTGSQLIVGEQGTGTLNVSGSGIASLAGGLGISGGAGPEGIGTVNLNGGTILTPSVVKNSGASASFNFNGGWLQATASSPSFMTGLTSTVVQAGGAFINDGGYAITIGSSLGGSGALAKSGSGTLTLSGANTYTGPTTVNGGTLDLSGSWNVGAGIATTSVASGATLSGAGVVTAATLSDSGAGTVNLSGNNAVGTLTASGTIGALTFNDAHALSLGPLSSSGPVVVTTASGFDLNVGSAAVSSSHPSGNAMLLISGHDLTLASGASLSGASPVLAAANAFINNAGAGAVAATSGRWLIYSSAPGSDSFGGLDSGNTALWNATYASRPPGSIAAAGNRYLFATQPALTFTPTSLAKTYGTDATSTLATSYAVSGYQPGVAHAFLADTAATVFGGSPLLTSSGAAATASVAGGPYAVNIAQGSLVSAAGYAFGFGGPATLTVAPAPVMVRALGGASLYGETSFNPGIAATGLQNGDTVSALTGLSNSFGITSQTPVGSYTLSVAGTLTNPNYVVAGISPATWYVISQDKPSTTPGLHAGAAEWVCTAASLGSGSTRSICGSRVSDR